VSIVRYVAYLDSYIPTPQSTGCNLRVTSVNVKAVASAVLVILPALFYTVASQFYRYNVCFGPTVIFCVRAVIPSYISLTQQTLPFNGTLYEVHGAAIDFTAKIPGLALTLLENGTTGMFCS
jgi:hypothetical protein